MSAGAVGPAVADFIAALDGLLRIWKAERRELAAPLEAVSAGLARRAHESRPPAPRAEAVCRHLPAALTEAESGPAAGVAARVRALAPHLRWLQTYRTGPVAPAFFDNYAQATVVGPGAMLHSDAVAVGLVLLGPETLYPAHAHPAGELYYLLAGGAGWKVGEEDWRERPPGSLIHHPPQAAHAMRTGARPLLALYAWYGEIAEPSRFV